MSGAFTPAPWAVNPLNAQVDAFDSGEPVPVCQLLWPTELRSEDETLANAALIATAPELYEKAEALLRDANARADLFDARCRDLRAALAKAVQS